MNEKEKILSFINNQKLLERDENLYNVIESNLVICYDYLVFLSKLTDDFERCINITNLDCLLFFQYNDLCDNTIQTLLD